MRICVVTPRYSIAGVPLAQIRLARALANIGFEVDLIIGRIDQELPVPEIPGVNVLKLYKSRVRGMLVPLCKYLYREKPDVVFSAEDHLNAFVLLAAILSSSEAKISGSSRVLPVGSVSYSNVVLSKGWVMKQFMKAVMWRADALTCVSQDMVGYYRKIFNQAPHVCVYNIIKDQKSINRSREPVDHEWLIEKQCPVIISAGTLTRRKGFSNLIRAFSIVSQQRSARLIIFGEGHLRDDLESLIATLGLTDRVSLPGNISNPLKHFAHSDVFVLSSYSEGMPNVLLEAMLCGCTPVATDCPTGPREILEDGKYGHLVPMGDPVRMAKAIELTLDRPIPAEMLAEALEPFDEHNVIRRHFEILGLTAQFLKMVQP